MPADSTSAAELTHEQVQAMLVQPLEQASVFLAAGPRIFDTDGNQVRIPKFTSMTAPSWHIENELIDQVEAVFDEVILLPNDMASVKSLTRFSNEIARQSVVALDAALRDKMVRDVAAKIDTAFIAGTGAATTGGGATPVGLVNYANSQEMTGVGEVTLDDFQDAVGLALGANVNTDSLRWMMTSRDFVNVRKIKDLDERYQVQPDPTKEGAFTLLGHPVTVTNRIPANGGVGTNESTIVLTDFSTIAVARDLAPSVKILDQTFADYDQMAIRVVTRYDAAPLQDDAVICMRGITPPAP